MLENARSSFLYWIQFHTQFNIVSSFLAAFSRNVNAFFSSLIRMGLIRSLNKTLAVTIPILVNLLQLKKDDPFSTHPITMRLAVSTTIAFYLVYTALLQFRLRRRAAIIADHCLLSVGNTSLASLSSVLLPDSYVPFVFAVFGVAELLYWLCDEFVTEINHLRRRRMFNINIWRRMFNNPTILPVSV